MAFQTLNPAGAKELLDGPEGWTYVDVRTAEEFDSGHVPGAWNVPLALRGPGGMELNPDFEAAMQRLFPKDRPLVLGCAAGGRSQRACEMLQAEGYTRLVNMHGGFSGARNVLGVVTERGWAACGFPTES